MYKIKNFKQYDFIISYIVFTFVFTLTIFNRHLFDDEIASILFIKNSNADNIFDLIKYTNLIDVSPPVQYIIPYAFKKAFGTFKYSALITLPLYFLIFYLSKKYIISNLKCQNLKFIFFLFLILNPSILMWGTSIRWYTYWFPLFIIFSYLYFYSSNNLKNRILILITILAMSYISYLTYVLITIIIILEIILLIYFKKESIFLKLNKKDILFFVIFILLSLPQFINLLENQASHVLSSQTFTFSMSFIKTLVTMFIGNAIFPLEVTSIFYSIAIISFLIFFLFRQKIHNEVSMKILIFILISLIIMTVTMQGYKLRNSIFLNFIFFLFLISNLGNYLKFKKFFSFIFIIFIFHCYLNIYFSSNTQKNSINTPVKKVLDFYKKKKKFCSFSEIYTYDIVLNYYLKNMLPNEYFSINKGNLKTNCYSIIETFSDRGFNKPLLKKKFRNATNTKNLNMKTFYIYYDKFNYIKKKIFRIEDKSFHIKIIFLN